LNHETSPALIGACITRYPLKAAAAKLRTALQADVTSSDAEYAGTMRQTTVVNCESVRGAGSVAWHLPPSGE
jgi:hypothetical protein